MSESRDQHPDDLAAYALGALGDADAAHVEGHLRTCAACRAELDGLRHGVQRLAADVPQLEPPAELKHRVMAQVTAQAELLRAADTATADRLGRRRRPLAIAAALALGALAALIVGLAVHGSGSPRETFSARVAQRLAPGGSASLTVDDHTPRLRVSHLPDPPAGHVYQVWVLRTGATRPRPTRALFGVRRGGRATVTVPDDARRIAQVLVTVEPAGGSPRPTTRPIVTAQRT